MCYYNKSHFEHKIININELNDIEYLKKENITIEEEKNDLEYHIKLINKLKNIIENELNKINNLYDKTIDDILKSYLIKKEELINEEKKIKRKFRYRSN